MSGGGSIHLGKKLNWNPDEVYDWASNHSQDNVREYCEKLKDLKCSSNRLLDSSIINDLVEEGIPKFAAQDIHDAMLQKYEAFNHQSNGPAAVFWDIENVPIPKGEHAHLVVSKLKLKVEKYGFMHKGINIFGDITVYAGDAMNELLASSCNPINTPHLGKKEVADKAIIAETLFFAMDHPVPASIIIVSGDADFAYMLSRLKDRGYRIILIYPSSVSKSKKGNLLLNAASEKLSWELDILGLPSESLQIESKNGLTPESSLQFNEKVLVVKPDNLFFDLVQAMKQLSSGGTKLRRSAVAIKIKDNNVDIYSREAFVRENVKSFKQYSKRAADASLVDIGGDAGEAWIELKLNVVVLGDIENP